MLLCILQQRCLDSILVLMLSDGQCLRKDAEQLRNDQTRHEAEIRGECVRVQTVGVGTPTRGPPTLQGRCKADALKIKHHIAESQARDWKATGICKVHSGSGSHFRV